MRYIGLALWLLVFVAAAWPPNGVPVCGQAGAQLQPAAADDGAGGAWVAWRDDRSPATGSDIYARHLDKNGAPLGAAAGIPVCVAPGAQTAPTLIADGAGGCVIAWNDARNGLTGLDVFAQRLDADGHPLWPVNGTGAMVTFGEQSAPSLLPDSFGKYYLLWQDARSNASGFDIYAQRLDVDGLPLWDPVGVRICGAPGAQTRPAFVPDGTGGFIAAWVDRRGGVDDDIYAQRYSVNAARLWAADGVPVCTLSGDQQPATGAAWLATDNAGGAFLAWTDRRNAARPAALLQRLQPDGARAAGWPLNGLAVCAAAGGQTEPGLLADGAGGVLVGWLDARSGATEECYVGRRTATGAVFPGWPADGLSLTTRAGTKSQLRLAPDGGGGARAAWSVGSGPGSDLDGQWITAQGARLGPITGLRLCAATGAQSAPTLAPLPDGDAILAWADQRTTGSTGSDIYAQRFVGALGNLKASPPAGFAAAVIPCDTPNGGPGGVAVPAVLPGNAPLTWLNAAFYLEGPGALPAWETGLKLDGVPVGTGAFGEELPPGVVTQLNQGPFTVRGGRHTLALDLDPSSTAGENDEQDNGLSAQWVWSPLPLLPGVPQSRPAPPAAGSFAEPNADGFVFAPAAGAAWVVGVASRSDLSDVNLYLYDDYTGSHAGFSHRRAVSTEAAAATDFIVGTRDSAPRTLYPAACRGGSTQHGGASGSGFAIDGQDAAGRATAQFPAVWPAQPLPPDRLVQVFEVQLTAGQSYDFRLLREQGTADLAFGLFGGTAAVITARAGAKALSAALDDVSDALTYTPNSSGWYALVVYRVSGTELEMGDVYSLYAFSGVVGVAERPDPGAPAVRLSVPNPARGAVELAVTLAAPGPLRVEIFDVRGRLVRRITDGPAAAGSFRFRWDGRDERGVAVASGVFHARVTTATGGLDHPFVRLR